MGYTFSCCKGCDVVKYKLSSYTGLKYQKSAQDKMFVMRISFWLFYVVNNNVEPLNLAVYKGGSIDPVRYFLTFVYFWLIHLDAEKEINNVFSAM